jgi:uncharacterized protein YodC (DUF2158 family)
MSTSGKDSHGTAGVDLTLLSIVTLACGAKLTVKELLAVAIANKDVQSEIESHCEEQLLRGDVVQLRSGGPPMTVSRVHRVRKLLDCYWFDLQGRLRNQAFPKIAVWKLNPETGRPVRLSRVADLELQNKAVVSEEEIPF